MVVCIAEKPSVAREIAQIIGANQQRKGYYEGNGYQVTWTFGHLCTLKEPDDYHKDLKRWNLHHLPIIPQKFGIKLISRKGISEQFEVIENLVGKATEIINCGDAGQEGELIQRWVLQKASAKCPIKRLWISSLTEEAIKEGFKKLYDSKDFDALYAAGSARAIGDWLLGINATRLYTLKYGQGKQVLSIGRVQTPTLTLIVTRQLEIENFKPEAYWELYTKYREVIFKSEKGKIEKKETGEALLNQVKDHDFTITSFVKKEGKELPYPLFDLTSLQVTCNQKLNLTAEQTLKTVQSLYEKKVVTYPRVDTTFLPNDMYAKIPAALKSLKNYTQFTDPILSKKIRKPKKVFNDKKVTDHHAIIPTPVVANNLPTVEAKVYDLIARRFIAAFSDDCIVSKTQVLGEANQVKFKANGKEILKPGWRLVWDGNQEQEGNDNSKEQDDNQLLPTFEEGEFGPHEPKLEEKMTSPPKYFTEATLLRAMETAGKQVDDDELRQLMKENGIGRPSTRANIIETLFRRNYIQKEKKRLIATPTGVSLIQTIDNELLKSVELTGQWEQKLRQIENEELPVGDFMKELKNMVHEVVQQVKTAPSKKIVSVVDSPKKEAPKSTSAPKKATKPATTLDGLKCPKCNSGNILKGKNAFGCSQWKTGCDFKVSFTHFEKKLTEKQIIQLIEKGKTSSIKGFKQDGTTVEGSLRFDKAMQVELLIKQEGDITCPKCQKGNIVSGKTAWGCTNWKNGCTVRIPHNIYEKEISRNQVIKLCAKGKSTLIKGWKKEGKEVNGYLVWGEDFKISLQEK